MHLMLEIAPLCLYLIVSFQLHIALCIFEAQLGIGRNQVVEQQRIHAFILIFWFHRYQQQIKTIAILVQI